MGGEGPAVTFDPSGISTWSARTGLNVFSDAEREAAYGRARSFFLEQMEELVTTTEWKATDIMDIDGVPLLFHLTRTSRQRSSGGLALPLSSSSFLDRSQMEMWRKVVENGAIFDAKRLNRNSSTLFIDSLRPLANIFYLLQVLAPGMFLIWRIDEIDDFGEQETSRALPDQVWIEDHRALLEEVLGSVDKVQTLLEAAKNHKIAFHEEYTRLYDEYGPDEPTYTDYDGNVHAMDYTACSLECGYCGRCDYD